jgi:hypothetical protein
MENQTQPPAQLTITDMASVLNIIDVACARGAFRANEMSALGPVYDRLKMFVDASAALAKATDDPEAASEEAAGENNA